MNYRLPKLEDYEILKEHVIEHYSNYERSISASLGMTKLDFSPAIKAMRIPISPKQDTIAVGLVPIGPPCHYVALNGCQLAYA